MTLPVFTMTRLFDAPRDLVWRTWTDPELVQRWYGPGVETVLHEFNPTPGGLWLNEMRMGENSMYQRMEFTEVEPPARLVILMSNSTAEWEPTDSPMNPTWPRTLLTTVTFAEAGDQTEMVLTWEPHGASDEQVEAFRAALGDLDKGWGKGMEVVAEILAELLA